MSKKSSKLKAVLGHLLLALCLAFSVCSYSLAQEIPPEIFQTLDNNNNKLVMKLTELELELSKQKNPLQEQINELMKCRENLATSQRELAIANEKLTISQNSLENVRRLQKETEQSLKNIEKKIVKYKRQRVYGWVLGGLLGYLIGNKIS